MIPSFSLLEMKVNPVLYSQILDQMDFWIRTREIGHYVLFANVHSVMEFQKNLNFRRAAENADLIAPDGMPLVVVGHWRGFHLQQRTDGPGFMIEAMMFSGEKGWGHFFYGGTPKTIDNLVERLRFRWPAVKVVGEYSPPFRPLTEVEERDVMKQINDADADVLWVGLGCPKQEIWMWEHRNRLNVPVMLGVGQAFDLMAGAKKYAPSWICNIGLEWMYRLCNEPRRLWKRYLINNPWFIYLVIKEELKFKVKKVY